MKRKIPVRQTNRNQKLLSHPGVHVCSSDRCRCCWDYELQVSLSEALCRLTPRKDRRQRANHWFSSFDISNAFCNIKDGDFEVVSDSPVYPYTCLSVWRLVTTPVCLKACLSLHLSVSALVSLSRTADVSWTLLTVTMVTREGDKLH